jgi:AcrR family transcriptional regulator
MTPTAVDLLARPNDVPRSARKRRAILDAATDMFLREGYLGTNMDAIAAQSAVSKQSVYKHFGSKEALFVEIVTSMCSAASDAVHGEFPEFVGDDLAAYLRDYAYRQLAIVLTPRLMQLRRLVIGESNRFPALGKAFYESGPRRAIAAIANVLSSLTGRGLLAIDDPLIAASQFNWLIMSTPLNRAMFLGDAVIPKRTELRRHAAEGVRAFLAAYETHRDPAAR